MNCENANILFDKYFNKQLNIEEIRLFEKHLIQCKRCSAAFNLYKDAMLFIKKDRLVEIDTDFFKVIKNKLNQQKGKEISISAKKSYFLYVAASVIVFLSILTGLIIGNYYSEKHLSDSPDIYIENELFQENLNLDFLNEI